jgi:hypothetical protein
MLASAQALSAEKDGTVVTMRKELQRMEYKHRKRLERALCEAAGKLGDNSYIYIYIHIYLFGYTNI